MSVLFPVSPNDFDAAAHKSPGLALVADVGGTNARFALAHRDAAGPRLVEGSMRRFMVAEFASLADVAERYLSETGAEGLDVEVHDAVIAVAGRVADGQAHITNLPWVISTPQLESALGLRSLSLVNDFAAQAMAIPALAGDDIVPIGRMPFDSMQPPASGDVTPDSMVDRSYAIIGPGTGLGVGGLLRRDGRYCLVESEGGHAGFAPETALEIEVLRHLSERFGRVSNERLISGAGLVNLHRALATIDGTPVGAVDPSDITRQAREGDALSVRAIEIFCNVFGAAAGDVALALGAWDGVYLTGGLVPRLLPTLQGAGFRQRFEGKGRLAPAMSRIPVMAIVHPQPGLLGAAAIAATSTRCA